ncbi:MAG: gamma-glutamyltransferase, partial [Gammaproteobacteria bacterium]|nr:gamma-glutamyltransferase [Gammaproteobacteria bacterium]
MKNKFYFIVFLLLAFQAHAAEETRKPAQAAIASGHHLATQAGFEILAKGGNAFDAAVAVASTLAVVEPYRSGLGGGGFWLLHREEDGMQTMVDGREMAPGAATVDMYLDEHGEVQKQLPKQGPLAAGIPGEPAAFVHITEKYGRLTLAENLAPAIRYAREGFPVGHMYRAALTESKVRLLQRWQAAADVFLDNGKVPEQGWVLKQPELARTLEMLAQQGHDGFYAGEVARKLAAGVKAAGGIWRQSDLKKYRVKERKPLRGEYRNATIVTAPPPSSGGVVLLNALNILGGYDIPNMSQVDRVHLITEALRRGFRDRSEYLGDPDFVSMPLERLLHPFYAAGQRISISTAQATPSTQLAASVYEGDKGTETTHFSVLDREGNRAAVTLSLNFWFGSGFMVPGTGVLLNNEMDDFSAKPGTPDGYGLVANTAN